MLKHASENCCDGHACDFCPTCARGRCCRKDAPLYQLPKLLEWDGPLYGEPGVLASDATGERVQCPLCGHWKVTLGLHLWFEHNRTSAELRAIWGLRQRTGLAAPNYKQKVRAANTERLQRTRPRPSYVETLTPEQRSALKENVGLPLETLLSPQYKEARKRVGALTTARARIYLCGCGCAQPLPPGNGPHRGQRYIRGHVPPTLADRVLHQMQERLGHTGLALRSLEVARALDQRDDDVRRALGTLVQQGTVERRERGLYALPAEKQKEP